MNLWLLILTVCVQLCSLQGYKILLFPVGLEDHQLYFIRLSEELVKRGHQVTFLIGDKKNVVPDIKVSAFFVHPNRTSGLKTQAGHCMGFWRRRS